MAESDVSRVRRRAEAYLVDSQYSGTVRDPIPIENPAGGLHSWCVPVTIEARLAGYVHLLPDLSVARYSAYPGRPDFDAWMTPAGVLASAGAMRRPDEELAAPVLTFDRDPSRLVWCVRARNQRGASRRIFVAGETAYEGGGEEGVTG